MKFFPAFILLICLPLANHAEPTRIEVYPISQAFVNVNRGDTLGDIIRRLPVTDSATRKQLMRDIVALNPHAFINNDPNRLRAHVRLWLPGPLSPLHRQVDRKKYRISEFSWGYIQRPR